MDLEYDNPEMKEEPLEQKVVEPPNEQVMIKKQSKDETTDQVFSVKSPSMFETLNDLVTNYLPSAVQKEKAKFDPDDFYQRLKSDKQYSLNSSWVQDFSVMSCSAQSFLERFSIQGEFFENY